MWLETPEKARESVMRFTRVAATTWFRKNRAQAAAAKALFWAVDADRRTAGVVF